MLSAMQAIAMMTTSVALVSVSPPASNANGSTTSAIAAMTTGCSAPTTLLEPEYPFAEQAARTEQEHEHHQQIHRRFRRGWKEVHGQSAHDADDDGRADDTPERSQSADHDDDERRRQDLGTHCR